jgi:hypothetical protein
VGTARGVSQARRAVLGESDVHSHIPIRAADASRPLRPPRLPVDDEYDDNNDDERLREVAAALEGFQEQLREAQVTLDVIGAIVGHAAEDVMRTLRRARRASV